jgi:hypothetical protein
VFLCCGLVKPWQGLPQIFDKIQQTYAPLVNYTRKKKHQQNPNLKNENMKAISTSPHKQKIVSGVCSVLFLSLPITGAEEEKLCGRSTHTHTWRALSTNHNTQHKRVFTDRIVQR